MFNSRLTAFRFLTFPCLLAFTILSSSANSAELTNSWHQWRGPSRDSQIEAATWPSSIGENSLNEIWKVKLGPSYSGPIVSEDKVFVTETKDRKQEVVTALDRKTGKEIWKAEWTGSLSVPFFAASNGSWIRSTPAYDGKSLFVGGIRDVLVSFNAEDGSENWRVDFPKELKSTLPAFGFVCSPLVQGEFVYVQAGGGLVKLNKSTGEIVWTKLKDGGGMNGSAFSSPYMTSIDDTPQLLVQTRSKLCGVNPDSGDELWSQKIPAFRGMNIVTPVIHNNQIFTSSYGGGSYLFDVSKVDDQWKLEESWKNKVQGYMSSPVIIDGHVYLHLRNQRFTCIELKTGESKWTTKPFGKYWSMVVNGSQILALDERGELLLIKANPEEFELVSRYKLKDTSSTWAHLAVVGDELFIRELNAMTVYQWKDAEEKKE